MKRTILMLTMMVATMMASDTSRKLNFKVSFPFQVGKVTMPAGEYQVSSLALSGTSFGIRNVQTGRAVMVALPTRTTQQLSKAPLIEFRCAEKVCEVQSVSHLRDGVRNEAWKKDGKFQIVAVALTPETVKGE